MMGLLPQVWAFCPTSTKWPINTLLNLQILQQLLQVTWIAIPVPKSPLRAHIYYDLNANAQLFCISLDLGSILDSSDTAQKMFSSRIDYCNALLVNFPSSTLIPLQCVLNTAARVISLLPKYECVMYVLLSLRFLKINQIIEY